MIADDQPTRIDAARLDATIATTCEAVFENFHPRGRFLAPGDAGIHSTLQVAATFHFLGLSDTLGMPGVAKTIVDSQLPHGAFPNFPNDPNGDPWVTALAVGVLRLIPSAPGVTEAIARGERWIDSVGGRALTDDGLYRVNICPLFLAMTGQLSLDALPDITAAPLLLDPVLGNARKHVNVACLWMGVAVWSVFKGLRHPEHIQSPTWLDSLERKRALAILDQFQNPIGNFNATVMQTCLAAAAYHCLGVEADDPRLVRAVAWLRHAQDPTPPGAGTVSFHSFHTSVWTTALLVRSLFACGVPRTNPYVVRALEWLVRVQDEVALPPLVPSQDGAPRSGGWPFTAHNPTVPDADDTAVVLGTLALAVQADGDDKLDPATDDLVRGALSKGLAYQLGMQNPDGGWPAFQWGLPSKPRGPILVHYPHFERGKSLSEVSTLLKNALLFGDPATEDITGRTLFALGELGYTKDSPVVRRAIAFLEAQQCTAEDLGGGAAHAGGGPWWSRWIANYLSGTAYVLGGLAAVGVDPAEPFMQRAIAWVLRRQNADGGFGESTASYQDPAQAGLGPSMPATTGLVLSGLIQAGQGDTEAVRRGIRYLLDSPRDDAGMWADLGPHHVFYRTDTFYLFTGARFYYPLEALGRYRAFLAGTAPAVAVGDVRTPRVAARRAGAEATRSPRDAAGRWSAAGLEAARERGDALADEVVRAIFSAGRLPAINALIATMVRNDDPVPAGLPPAAEDYFRRTAALPQWADPAKLAQAAAVFERAGWATAIALFNAALPQCYAAAKGARVLVGTRGLLDAPERRILETAQFIFDVTGRGGFEGEGLAVRAAQKVRLLHAAIRHLTQAQASWNADWGVPINQEDTAGTLMSFSVLIIDAWKKMGLSFTVAETDAWLHLWLVVGHVMGVEPALLPKGYDDGADLWRHIAALQWAPSDAGRALTRGLMTVSHAYLPRFADPLMPSTMIRYFSGDACADLLGLPPSDGSLRIIESASHLLAEHDGDGHDGRLLRALELVSYDLMKALVLVKRAGKETRFRIPPALLHSWNLKD